MLHPAHRDTTALADRWRERSSMRIAPLLDEAIADALLAQLRVQPHQLSASSPPAFGFQYWVHAFRPEADCDHLLCRFGRWLHGPFADWVGGFTGLALGPPADRIVMATRFGRGSYIAPHNDYDGARQIAFVIGLTREAWPATGGGHLTFADGEVRAPGWNCVDLFDVRAPVRTHEVPMMLAERERRAVTGWLYAAEGCD